MALPRRAATHIVVLTVDGCADVLQIHIEGIETKSVARGMRRLSTAWKKPYR